MAERIKKSEIVSDDSGIQLLFNHGMDARILIRDSPQFKDPAINQETADIRTFDYDSIFSRNQGESLAARARYAKFGRVILNLVKMGIFGDVEQAKNKQGQILFDELTAIRKFKYTHFHKKFNEAITRAASGHSSEAARWQRRAIHMNSAPSPENQREIERDFPAGNFLFHGASTDACIKILTSGKLMDSNAVAAVAKTKGESFKSRGGTEGISWSFNSIDALPGDRYHMAGFVTSIGLALEEGQQLAVPANPALFELQQVTGNVDMNRIRVLGIQDKNFNSKYSRTYEITNKNSGDIVNSLQFFIESLKNNTPDESPLYKWLQGSLKTSGTDRQALIEKIRGVTLPNGKFEPNAKMRSDGHIYMSSALGERKKDDNVPRSVAYLQAFLDSISAPSPGQPKDVIELLERIAKNPTGHSATKVTARVKYDADFHNSQFDSEAKNIEPTIVDIENLWFVCSDADLPQWSKVIAGLPHKPRGIMTYDGDTVRISDWQNRYGDYEELSRQLKQTIDPRNKGKAYEEILGLDRHAGEELDYSKRAYGKHQVIASKYLRKAKVLKKINGTTRLV